MTVPGIPRAKLINLQHKQQQNHPTFSVIMLNFIRRQQKTELLKTSFMKFSANGLSSAYTWVGEILTANKAAGAMMFTGSVLYGLVRADIYSFKTDLRGEMSASEARLKADMSASEVRVKADLKASEDRVMAKIEEVFSKK